MIIINSNTVLSVIVPVFNTKVHLRNCLNSIIDTKTSGYEIILVDDGSFDGSSNICDEYAEQYPFIKTLHKQNGGLASARNTGLGVAKGNYVTFIDSDDYVENGYINSVRDSILNYGSDIIVFSHYIDYAELSYSNPCILPGAVDLEPKVALPVLESNGAFYMCWDKVYKREMLEAPNSISFLPGGEPGEDMVFNCLCFQKAKTVTILDKAFYHWIRREEETLANRFREDLFDKNKVFIDYRNNLYKNLNIDKSNIKNLAAGNLRYIFACVPNMYRAGKRIKRKKRISFYKEILASGDVGYWMANTSPTGFLQKQFFTLYKTKSPLIMDTFYLSAMTFRNSFSKIWLIIRKKFIHEKANS